MSLPARSSFRRLLLPRPPPRSSIYASSSGETTFQPCPSEVGTAVTHLIFWAGDFSSSVDSSFEKFSENRVGFFRRLPGGANGLTPPRPRYEEESCACLRDRGQVRPRRRGNTVVRHTRRSPEINCVPPKKSIILLAGSGIFVEEASPSAADILRLR